MRIWTNEHEFDLAASVAALGTFDGVHIGHQALIRRAKALAAELNAACVVCTFDRHPLSLLNPCRAPVPLTSLEEKLEKFEALGVDGVLLKPFTREFAAIEPVEYLNTLSRQMHVRGVVAGFNYSFGAGGRGNAEMIRAEAGRLGYRAEIVEAIVDGGDTVSSTLIRSLLAEGKILRAQALLALQGDKL